MVLILHRGGRPSKGPPFHGSSFHTEFTGYHWSMKSPSTSGIRSTPGQVLTIVLCSSIRRAPSASSARPSASVTTRPPKVGSSLNQPRMGITVRPNMVVSKEDSRVPLSKSRRWAMRPTVEVPHESTCSWCSLKNTSAFLAGSVHPSHWPNKGIPGDEFSASSMARKKGEERNSSTSLYTSSHSPAKAASLTAPDCLLSASTRRAICPRFSW
mmetsp:Transcript_112964/g.300097  ORF Transcript_112964/g.300097 Transcript_112964/m.300097 type:complete len:212 (-) Transcript_112964:203-838(-)